MRLPVTPALSTKDGVVNKNARMTNVLREKNKAVVRPGLSAVFDYAGLGAGLIPFNGRLIAIFDDTIYADNNVGAAPDVAFPLDSLPWSAATTYTFGDSVWYNGVLWFSIASGNTNNTPASGAWWASSYPPAWNSGYTYPAGAFVNYGGYLWESLQDENLDNTPELGSAFWLSPNPPASATHSLVAANFTEPLASSPQYTGIGFYLGGAPTPAGSLTPQTIGGSNVNVIATYLTYSEPITLPVFIVQIASEELQSFFNTITISGYGAITTSSADFFGSGDGISQWAWNGIDPFVAGPDTYTVTIA